MSRFPRVLPLTVATAFFMEGLDSSVVTTALPAIARDLKSTVPDLAAAITAYLISLAIFMPLGGWLSDRFGARTVFISAITMFAMGSLTCSFAPSATALIGGRIVQGIGGAMMVPVGRATLMNSVPKSEYVRVMNYVIIPALIGPAAGPLVGGFLSTYASWHWIFLVNLPLALVGIVMALRYFPAGVAEGGKPSPFDWVGYAFLTVALGVGQAAIEMLGHGKSRYGFSIAAAVAFAAGLLFYRRFRVIGSGLLDLELLRIRTFRLSVTAGSLARTGLGGVTLLLPLLLQLVFGYTPFQSGIVTFLVAIGSAVIKPVMSVSLRSLGVRRLVLTNSVGTALGLLGFLAFREKSWLWLISPYVFAFGLLRSVQMSTMNALSYADIQKPLMSRASTFSTLCQRLSVGLGVNIAAVVLNLAGRGSPPGLHAFAIAFLVSAVLVVVAGAMFLELHEDDGWQVSNRPRAATNPFEGREADGVAAEL